MNTMVTSGCRPEVEIWLYRGIDVARLDAGRTGASPELEYQAHLHSLWIYLLLIHASYVKLHYNMPFPEEISKKFSLLPLVRGGGLA